MDFAGYKKILIPVDGSRNSFKALAHAGQVAVKFGAEVDLLFVLCSVSGMQIYSELGMYYIPEQTYDADREFGTKVLQEAAIALPAGIKTSAYMETGAAAEVICHFAAQHQNDLIVMGGRGLGTIKELLVGSVSHYVLHRAKSPVLLIK